MSEPNRRAELVAMLREWVEGAPCICADWMALGGKPPCRVCRTRALLDRPDPAPVTTSREFGEAVFALHSLDKPSPVAAPDLAGLAAWVEEIIYENERSLNTTKYVVKTEHARELLAALEWAAGRERRAAELSAEVAKTFAKKDRDIDTALRNGDNKKFPAAFAEVVSERNRLAALLAAGEAEEK